MAGNFTLDLSRFINRTRSNADLVTKKVVLDIARSVIRKSPVGNPDLWVALRNGEYQDYASVHGEIGYTGGRFKANWMFGTATMPTGTTADIDPSGRGTLAGIEGQIPTQASGKLHYIVNNLPYSIRLENGWSSQAPQGMVGLTIVEYQGIVRRAVAEMDA
jgi:hypothetical protein